MLKLLRLKNFILVESSEIAFHQGLNIITGETGSGKSAVMSALLFLSGERSGANLLRHGEEKGSVEASFSIEGQEELIQMLQERGFDLEEGEELLVRREINDKGKTRAYINHQLAQVSFLKIFIPLLFKSVGQHANRRLVALDEHRESVDQYGMLHSLRKSFSEGWEKEKRKRQALLLLEQEEASRYRQQDTWRTEIDEIDAAALKEEEEEELFTEYTRLTNSEEISEKTRSLLDLFEGNHSPILPLLRKAQQTLEQLISLNPLVEESRETLSSAVVELEEVAHTLRNSQGQIEYLPGRIVEIDGRLSQINKLKKKYGASVEEIQKYREQIGEQLEKLENRDLEIEKLKEEIEVLALKNHTLAQELSEKRRAVAKKLEKEIEKQLHDLNIKKATFHIGITPQERTAKGDDRIEFFFAPNVGEKKVALREHASGGELSRIMLALETLLAGKEKPRTIIFDEIDANIGGETATAVGEKLRNLGKELQVLCITHFSQVAQFADHHFSISKREHSGRTVTEILYLKQKEREKELNRMVGIT